MTNKKKIVLLSGELASGKSTLARMLVERYGFTHLMSSDALKSMGRKHFRGKDVPREELQKLGAKKDRQTNCQWIVDEFHTQIIESELVLVDAIRMKMQADRFRSAYGQHVCHIHLTASPAVLKDRFMRRNKEGLATPKEQEEKYREYKSDPTELGVPELAQYADFVINTDVSSPEDRLIVAASILKLLSPTQNQLVDIVVGAQFGSEGKGQIAAHLAPEYDCLVRVGGPNAGHSVFEQNNPDVFHIIPSGTNRNPNAQLIIGPGAVVNKDKLLKEITNYHAQDRIIIDPNATVISARDISDERRMDSIGSTKSGVGAATARNLFNRRLASENKHKAKYCRELSAFISSAHDEYEKVFVRNGKILLEGTQGSMLDLHHGYYPYVTSRPTTASGCLAEAGIGPQRVRKVIVVARSYPIRVQSPDEGTSGPFGDDLKFPYEISWEEIARRSGIPLDTLKRTEITTTTRRERRVAEFNWALFRKACAMNSATDIALTFVDYFSKQNQEKRFSQLTPDTHKFIEDIERCAGIPVSLVATGFSFKSVIDRRNWG